jgi:hypothetical protein
MYTQLSTRFPIDSPRGFPSRFEVFTSNVVISELSSIQNAKSAEVTEKRRAQMEIYLNACIQKPQFRECWEWNYFFQVKTNVWYLLKSTFLTFREALWSRVPKRKISHHLAGLRLRTNIWYEKKMPNEWRLKSGGYLGYPLHWGLRCPIFNGKRSGGWTRCKYTHSFLFLVIFKPNCLNPAKFSLKRFSTTDYINYLYKGRGISKNKVPLF